MVESMVVDRGQKLTWSEMTDKAQMEREGIAVDIQGVTKRFTTQQGDEVTALREVNLKIREHDFICVVGRSGCGKTTFLNMLAGFERPTEGRIIAAGVPVTKPSPRRGVVFQKPPLYPWLTVRKNVEFGMRMQGVPAKERNARAAHFLEVVGLADGGGATSVRALWWYAAACADSQGTCHGSGCDFDGRALRCAGCIDAGTVAK